MISGKWLLMLESVKAYLKVDAQSAEALAEVYKLNEC